MADISRVGGVQPADAGAGRIRRVGARPPVEQPLDQVQLSTQSQQVAEIAKVTELAKTATDLRVDKITRAEERVASGEYLTRTVSEAVAHRLLEELS